MECPVCGTEMSGYVTFKCGHSTCNQCLLRWLNQRKNTCSLCRADITDSIPPEIMAEVQPVDDTGYESTDEFDPDASHLKIRCGSREIAFIRNDGKRRDIYYEDGDLRFRIEYRNRKCYLFRRDEPTPIPIHPLRSICAVNRGVNPADVAINSVR